MCSERIGSKSLRKMPLGVRNSMEMAKELVEENTIVAQVKQKAYYMYMYT